MVSAHFSNITRARKCAWKQMVASGWGAEPTALAPAPAGVAPVVAFLDSFLDSFFKEEEEVEE